VGRSKKTNCRGRKKKENEGGTGTAKLLRTLGLSHGSTQLVHCQKNPPFDPKWKNKKGSMVGKLGKGANSRQGKMLVNKKSRRQGEGGHHRLRWKSCPTEHDGKAQKRGPGRSSPLCQGQEKNRKGKSEEFERKKLLGT